MAEQRGQAGTTIIELLVVVSIIAVLVAVLVPAMGYARTQSKRTECLAQLKSLGLTVALYSDMHRGAAPSVPVYGSPKSVSDAVARLNFPNSPAHIQSSYITQSSMFTWIVAVATDNDLDRETCPSMPSANDFGGVEWFRFNGRDIRVSSYVMSRAFIADPAIFDSAAIARLDHLRARRMSQVAYPSAKVVAFETRLYHEPAWRREGADWGSQLLPVVFADGHGLLDGTERYSGGAMAANTGVTPSMLFDTPGGVSGRDLK